MSPRPRLLPDSIILAAAARVIDRVGPARLTLADVGHEVGLAPATLVQRFGSKRGLLLSLARQGASGVHEEFAALRAAARSPLHAIFDVCRCMASMAKTPEALANHLAFLEIDLADRDFHRLALAHARQFRAELRALIEEAVRAGELRPCLLGRLASSVHAVITGSLLNWAIYREGRSDAWIRADLQTLLRPYRALQARQEKRESPRRS